MKRDNFFDGMRFAAILLCFPMMLLAVSCNNDDNDSLLSELESSGQLLQDLDGDIDFDYIAGLAKSEVVHLFSNSTDEYYDRYASTGWEWVVNEDLIGKSCRTPGRFLIGRGKCYTPFNMSDRDVDYLPHPILLPWMAYQEATGRMLNLYLEEPFVMPSDDRQIKIGNRKYNIERFTPNRVVISYVNQSIRGDEVGEYMDITEYKVSDATFTFDETSLSFTSETELFETVIAMLREQFGETINLADWIEGNYSRPIVNISELEMMLLH